LKKKDTKKTAPKSKKKSDDNFVDNFLAAKIVGMDDDDAIAMAVFLDDE
jgi:hypothetical protein